MKQCSPVAKYEWILCPDGTEHAISWHAMPSVGGRTRRFRVTNKCTEPIWVQQASSETARIPDEPNIRRLEPLSTYTYAIPNRGLPSTRFLPKTGCDESGNRCHVQSMPPCPPQGCDLPMDTKFEASWGCRFAKGDSEDNTRCALTGQGNPSTYQDWWDGSAVDGWTLPFAVLVDDGGSGLTPGSSSSPGICSPVMCGNLNASRLCPRREFLTPI